MDSASSAASIAAAGLYAAQFQVGVTASNIANASDGNSTPTPAAPFGSTAVVATSTGTQPGGVSGNAFNALQTALNATPGGGVTATAEPYGGPNGPNDPTQQQLSLIAAQQLFHANLTTIQVANNLDNTTINLVG
jgi:flagellar basal body rod protein FlgC